MEKELLLISAELVKLGKNLDLVVINTINTAYTPNADINLVDLNSRQIRFALINLVRYLRTAKPEVMLSAETPVNALAIVARIITGYPRRLIVSERNHLSSVTKNATRLGDRIRPLLVKHLYPLADLILTVSHGVARDLIERYKMDPGKTRTLYNMFNINKIASASQIAPEHSWLGMDKSPVIINVGRLSPQKDQATLIKAFAIVRSKINCRLVILGEGSERSSLLQLARQLNVDQYMFMPGFVSNPYSYMSRANVFVLSSAWEGLPGVLIEAMACGTSVVASDCPSGPAEILEHGKYGRLTPVGDPKALAEAILETLHHPTSPELVYKRSMDFSIEHLLPQYLEIFQADSQNNSIAQ